MPGLSPSRSLGSLGSALPRLRDGDHKVNSQLLTTWGPMERFIVRNKDAFF